MKMTPAQCLQVLDTLDKVDAVLNSVISGINSNVFLDREDFKQVGYYALCRAATTYKADSRTSFATYAATCIKNALIDYAKRFRNQAIGQRTISLQSTAPNTDIYLDATLPDWKSDHGYMEIECMDLFSRLVKTTSGRVRTGVEIMALRYRNYTTGEIAAHYGVDSDIIRMWEYRARLALQRNSTFRTYFADRHSPKEKRKPKCSNSLPQSESTISA